MNLCIAPLINQSNRFQPYCFHGITSPGFLPGSASAALSAPAPRRAALCAPASRRAAPTKLRAHAPLRRASPMADSSQPPTIPSGAAADGTLPDGDDARRVEKER